MGGLKILDMIPTFVKRGDLLASYKLRLIEVTFSTVE